LLKDPASTIPRSKYAMIHQAAIGACDAGDGLKDGLIDDPSKCEFDPAVLLCQGADSPSCLTGPQVAAAQKIYSPATNPRTGQVLFSSLVPGTELGWAVPAPGPDTNPNIWDQYRFVVFKNPAWDWRSFDFDADIERSEGADNIVMNATDPNLKPFVAHNGKLLIYQGWADTNVPAPNTIKYYRSVTDTLGGSSKTMSNVRLFLAPGMGHCRGGDGPNEFDKVTALEQWVEQGKAPERLIASHRADGKVNRTRPLCPYPQVAKYKGSGSIDDAANFACQAP
jgi:feruloyl esterase